MKTFRLLVLPWAFSALVVSAAVQSPQSPRVDERKPAKFVVIPLIGSVGPDLDAESLTVSPCFTASDFKACIDEVRKSRCNAVVLHIKSPGGRVDSKEEIIGELLALRHVSPPVRSIAVIEEAGSAAALIALACDEWHVMPAARVGAAATVIRTSAGTKSLESLTSRDPELFKKYNSWSSAVDEEACRSTGRATLIATAMKESKATLFFTEGRGFTEKSVNETSIQLDGADTILTLTATQIVQCGLGQMTGSLDDVRKVIGQESEECTKKCARLIEQAKTNIAKGLATLQKAVKSKPPPVRSFSQRQGGRHDESARADEPWRKRVDAAVDKLLKLLDTP